MQLCNFIEIILHPNLENIDACLTNTLTDQLNLCIYFIKPNGTVCSNLINVATQSVKMRQGSPLCLCLQVYTVLFHNYQHFICL